MNKKIIVLNGAARKNGSTAKLVEAFADGAELQPTDYMRSLNVWDTASFRKRAYC